MALDSFICHRTHFRDAMCLIYVQAYRIVFGFDMSLPVCQHRADDSITESSGKNLRQLLFFLKKRPSIYIRGEGSKSYRLKIVHFGRRFIANVSTFRAADKCDPNPSVWRIFESHLKTFYDSSDEGSACRKVSVNTWQHKRIKNTVIHLWPSGIRFHDHIVLAAKDLRSRTERPVCSRERILAKLAQNPFLGSILSLQNTMYLTTG